MAPINSAYIDAHVRRSCDTNSLNTTPAFSIGTLVTDHAQYDAMRASFSAGGVVGDDCEYLHIDNSNGSQTDAFRGLNALLNASRAPYVVLCHQDVRLLEEGRAHLERCLAELSASDCTWAIAGNAGGVSMGKLALRISDPHGKNQRAGTFPQPVMSVDENFMIVRRDARIGFSRDLAGFHFYGADICLHAAQMGYTSYVIDFHLEHLSPGRKDDTFALAEQSFRAKWARALQPRWIQTTCSLLYLSGTPLHQRFGQLVARPLASALRRMPKATASTST